MFEICITDCDFAGSYAEAHPHKIQFRLTKWQSTSVDLTDADLETLIQIAIERRDSR